MTEGQEDVVALMGQFIAEGIIREVVPGKWRLTDRGAVIAKAIFDSHPHRDQALLLLYCKNRLEM